MVAVILFVTVYWGTLNAHAAGPEVTAEDAQRAALAWLYSAPTFVDGNQLSIKTETSGHAVVIDGVQHDTGATKYYHLNMGWGGTSDAYSHTGDQPLGGLSTPSAKVAVVRPSMTHQAGVVGGSTGYASGVVWLRKLCVKTA